MASRGKTNATPAGSAASGPADPSIASLEEVTAATLEPIRAATMMALPGVNAGSSLAMLGVVRAQTLAAVGTVDFPWLVFGPIGWVFSDQLDRLFGSIGGDPVGAATKAIAGVIGDVGNILWSIPGMIGAWILSAVIQGAQLVGGLVGGVIGSAATILSAGVGLAAGLLVAGVKAAGSTLGSLLYAGVTWAGAIVQATLREGWDVLRAVGGPIVAAVGTIAAPITDALYWAGSQIIGLPITMLQGLLNIGAWIIAQSGPIVADVSNWINVNVAQPLEKIATDAVKWAMDGLGAVGEGDPEAVLGLAAGLTAAAIPFGVAAHLLGNAAEVAHPLKSMGFTMTARALVDLTNISKISEATIGVGFLLAIGRPMEYWLSRRIRWRIPSEMELLVEYTKRDISEGEARLALAYHGYNESRISAMLESGWREPRPFELRRLMDSGVVPPAWLRSKLRRNMLRDEDAELMATALEHNQYSTQRSGLYSAAFALLRDGASTPERFAADVGPLALPDAQIALGVRAAALQHAADMVNFNTSTYLTAAVDGQLTVEEFGLALRALGLTDDRIAAEQARARVRITGKIASTAPAEAAALYRKVQSEGVTLWVERFRRGLVDAAGLNTNLLALGLDPSLARITVDIEVARQTPLVPVVPDTSAADTLAAAVKEMQKAYIDEFRTGLINDTNLTANLLALGLDPTLVDAIVIDEMAKKYVPPQTTPSPAEEAELRRELNAQSLYLRDQFRAGLIDQAAYYQGLVDAGMADILAAITVEREVLRAGIAAGKATATPASSSS
jgi:hypothetical protein